MAARGAPPPLTQGLRHATQAPPSLHHHTGRDPPSKPGTKHLEPFAGSGTTLISALRSGCSSLGIELNDPYAAEAEQRVLADAAKRGDALV